MPIGFICHGMHGVDNRKVISSDIYKCTDALILSGFRQCSETPKLPHHDLILRSWLAVSITIRNIFFNKSIAATPHPIFNYSEGGT